MRKKITIFILFFVVMAFINIPNACPATLTWSAVTTYTDNTLIPTSLAKFYTMKSAASASPSSWTIEGTTTATSGTVSEPSSGTTKWYTVSCTVDGRESANYSPPVSKTAVAVALVSLSVSPSTVVGGNPSTGTITLNVSAPSGGIIVSLSSNSSVAIVPSSVTVPAGSTIAAFQITTIVVSNSTVVSISAVYGGVTKTASLTVSAPNKIPFPPSDIWIQ